MHTLKTPRLTSWQLINGFSSRWSHDKQQLTPALPTAPPKKKTLFGYLSDMSVYVHILHKHLGKRMLQNIFSTMTETLRWLCSDHCNLGFVASYVVLKMESITYHSVCFGKHMLPYLRHSKRLQHFFQVIKRLQKSMKANLLFKTMLLLIRLRLLKRITWLFYLKETQMISWKISSNKGST